MERAGIDDTYIDRHYHAGDPVAHIIGLNIHRRHLTKQQQADLIVAAHIAVGRAEAVLAAYDTVAENKLRQPGEVSKGGRGKVNTVKAAAVATAKEHGIGKRTVERSIWAQERADRARYEEKHPEVEQARLARAKQHIEKRKARRAEFEARHGPMFGPTEDASSWQRLAKVLVRLSSDREGERQAAAAAANKLLKPLGWQLVEKRASTLAQDGRSQSAVDDPTLENCSREIEAVANAGPLKKKELRA
jgi:hypothetical protein